MDICIHQSNNSSRAALKACEGCPTEWSNGRGQQYGVALIVRILHAKHFFLPLAQVLHDGLTSFHSRVPSFRRERQKAFVDGRDNEFEEKLLHLMSTRT